MTYNLRTALSSKVPRRQSISERLLLIIDIEMADSWICMQSAARHRTQWRAEVHFADDCTGTLRQCEVCGQSQHNIGDRKRRLKQMRQVRYEFDKS